MSNSTFPFCDILHLIDEEVLLSLFSHEICLDRLMEDGVISDVVPREILPINKEYLKGLNIVRREVINKLS